MAAMDVEPTVDLPSLAYRLATFLTIADLRRLAAALELVAAQEAALLYVPERMVAPLMSVLNALALQAAPFLEPRTGQTALLLFGCCSSSVAPTPLATASACIDGATGLLFDACVSALPPSSLPSLVHPAVCFSRPDVVYRPNAKRSRPW